MKKEYDFSKGERGKFYQADASINLPNHPEKQEVMVTKQTESEIYRVLLAQLKSHLGKELRQVILFGSRARGTASEESDYDCLIIVDHLSDEVKDQMDEVCGNMLYDYDVLISAIPVTQERFENSPYNPLFMRIRQEGLTIWPNQNS